VAPYYGEDDIPEMLAEFGVDVSWNDGTKTIATKGLYDVVDEALLESVGGASVVGQVISVIVQTSVWPGIKSGAQILVGTEPHTVRDPRQEGDGATMRLICSKP